MSASAPLAPLQMGVPGGPELLVVVAIAILLFGVPLVVVAVVGYLWLRSDGDDYDERIAELEAEITRLQAEVGTDTVTGATVADTEAGDTDSDTSESESAGATDR